jgi:serine protease Do
LAELPVEREAAASSGGSDSRREQLGIKVEPLTAEQAARLGLRHETEGVVVDDVDPSGPAADAGIQPEDVILEVNH